MYFPIVRTSFFVWSIITVGNIFPIEESFVTFTSSSSILPSLGTILCKNLSKMPTKGIIKMTLQILKQVWAEAIAAPT